MQKKEAESKLECGWELGFEVAESHAKGNFEKLGRE